MTGPHILIFSGSIRTGSKNVRLAELLAAALPDYGGVPQLVSLRDFEMPIYNGDIEAQSGAPEAAWRLAELMSDHDGIIIVSPEYNASIPPLLKNTLDWVSRVRPAQGVNLAPFRRPVFALAGASPGAIGTLRGMTATRSMLELGFGALVIPEQLAVPLAAQAFSETGQLIAERPLVMMQKMLTSLVHKAQALQKVESHAT